MSDGKGMLQGKRIIVVGGAGLLGARICEAIAGAGANCVIADLSRQSAEAVAWRIGELGLPRPAVVEVSIAEEGSVEAMIEASTKALGGIDSVVNTAYPRNKNYGRKFEEVRYADFCENVNLHLGGYFLVSQRILEFYKRSGGGSLLNMSSIYGVIAPRFEAYNGTQMTMPVEYAAIKSGIIHLTKYMAKYYAGNNIRVNCLSIGGLYDRQPVAFLEKYREYCLDKGMLGPEDIVGTVVFSLSDSARYLNGQNLVVDDGFTL